MFDILKQDVVDSIIDDLFEIKMIAKKFENAKLESAQESKKPQYGKLISCDCLDKKSFTCTPLTKGHTAVMQNNTPVVRQFQISTTDNAICVGSDNKIFVLTFDELIRLAKDNDLFQVK